MSGLYNRVADINEKAKSVEITITQWRVLFSISENTSLDEIKSYVDEDENQIKKAIDVLLELKLIVTSEGSASEAASTKTEIIAEKEAEPEAVEEVENVVQAEVEAESVPEPEAVEETVVEEAAPEPEIEESVAEEPIVEPEPEPEAPVEEVAPEPVNEKTDIEAAVEKEAAPSTPPAAGGGAGGTLVVGDDSIVIRKMVELAFESETISVKGYSDGKALVDNIAADSPGVVLIDATVGGVPAEELIKSIKAAKDVPILMFLGKNAATDVEGVTDYVKKPFKDDELIAKVKSLV